MRSPEIGNYDPHRASDESLAFCRRNIPGLIGLNLGLRDEGYGLRLGAPYVANERQISSLETAGSDFRVLFQTANELYAKALRNELEPEVCDFVVRICDGAMNSSRRLFERELFINGEAKETPMFFRADMLDTTTAVEINSPGGGQALVQAVQKLVRSKYRLGEGLIKLWSKALKESTNLDAPRVLISASFGSQKANQYLRSIFLSEGVDLRFFGNGVKPPAPSEIDATINVDFSTSPLWNAYWQAHNDGNLVLDALPTAINTSKIPELLAFHPLTKGFFQEGIRNRFPNTQLVAEGVELTLDDGEKVLMEDLWTLPASKRKFVLKYAGSDRERCTGATHVYQLDGGREKCQKLMNAALDDWDWNNQPWLIQPRLKVDHMAYPYEDGKFSPQTMRARFMPYYVRIGEDVRLATASVLFNSNWKVHGNINAVHSPIMKSPY